MKIGYVALLSLGIAIPALAEESVKKTVDGVELECGVTGSSNDGWSIWGTNTTVVRKECRATCDLTDKNGKKERVTARPYPVNAKSAKTQLDANNGALKNPPYRSPVFNTASCINKPLT